MNKFILKFSEIRITDTAKVGGKNASLGEMFSQLSSKGLSIPDGFSTTAFAFQNFLEENNLHDPLQQLIDQLDKQNFSNLKEIGAKARALILSAKMPQHFRKAVLQAYKELMADQTMTVAVRSRATAEDLPQAS